MPRRKKVVLVTGASGEMGHGLIQRLSQRTHFDILALDIKSLDERLAGICHDQIVGDVLDPRLLERLVSEFEIHAVFHLAALLSTRSEFTPETAHEVNVRGTLNLLKLAVEQSRWHGRQVLFLFPSSIAVYGLPDFETKSSAGAVKEDEFNVPTTMYGCNKLYAEHLGRYYAEHYRQLAVEQKKGIDFRCLRFPGIISAFTVPHGGTSDYGPEMLHAAAQGEAYDCFVRPDARIPFMAMPDAIEALLRLMEAPADHLTRHVYNVTSFSPTAQDFADRVRTAFAGAHISFVPDAKRQAIIDTWPAELDDSAARRDWGFSPSLDFDGSFDDYLVPNIRERYGLKR
ncbi:MAG: NAD-dependent epimerase/dehydratase family protein [Deltaproteobacteria bacterium]|nr:NAD-dependent epimerase/dehydratase family protein [Deltaproteobacteria bacterium]